MVGGFQLFCLFIHLSCALLADYSVFVLGSPPFFGTLDGGVGGVKILVGNQTTFPFFANLTTLHLCVPSRLGGPAGTDTNADETIKVPRLSWPYKGSIQVPKHQVAGLTLAP